MPQFPPGPVARYENYPGEPPALSREPRIAPGVGRGAVTGMAAAALTVITVLPPRFSTDIEPAAAAYIVVMYSIVAAVFGTAPGAAVGALLTALARAGATRLPIRLLGGLAAPTVAALVSAPTHVLGWSGVVVATLCGVFAAPWVAWGPGRPTLG